MSKDLEKKIHELESLIDLHESGFFHGKYKFESIERYKDALKIVKDAQKIMIKKKIAFLCEVPDLKDSPIIKNLSKLAFLAFNSNCELVIGKVKYNNFEKCKEKIEKVFEQINSMLSPFNSQLSEEYMDSKIKELAIGLEFELEKQRIKEEQDEIKAQIREEQKAIAEAEKARDRAIAEEEKIELALSEARKEVEGKVVADRAAYEAKILELESKLEEASIERERATSNAQITSVGHVYIISNIGSFGENIYKIGMTRRDDPNERVNELGDASVPFKFDVHAFVFSENARRLENELHKYFENRRINKVNKRKEFFSVSLEEIEKACEELEIDIELTRLAEAKEYRESLDLDKQNDAA